MSERRDIDPGRVLTIGGGVLGLVLLTLIAMWWLLHRLERQQTAARPAAHALTAVEPPRVAPAPRLQVRPLADLEALRAREDAQLRGYGWVDQASGRVRIPVERAMELVAQEAGR